MLSSQDVAFFTVIASHTTLAAAARTLNVTPPSVSQRLQSIESKLGVKLIERHARALVLTEEGTILATRGQQVLDQLSALHEDVAHPAIMVSGDIKVVSSLVFGMKYIGPILGEFQQAYPKVKVELILTDNPKWGAFQQPDMMFYIGYLQDSSLHRVVLAKNRRLLLASPHYLEHAPALSCPSDLVHHNCIVLRENEEDATLWQFTHKPTGDVHHVRVTPTLSSNVGQVTKAWCVAGHGIIQRSQWDVAEELANGRLIEVLPDYHFAEADIVALLPTNSAFRSKKVDMCLSFIKDKLDLQLPI